MPYQFRFRDEAYRPIQDLYAFHMIGRKELRLDWSALIGAIADTPVEPVQAHYLRVAPPPGFRNDRTCFTP